MFQWISVSPPAVWICAVQFLGFVFSDSRFIVLVSLTIYFPIGFVSPAPRFPIFAPQRSLLARAEPGSLWRWWKINGFCPIAAGCSVRTFEHRNIATALFVLKCFKPLWWQVPLTGGGTGSQFHQFLEITEKQNWHTELSGFCNVSGYRCLTQNHIKCLDQRCVNLFRHDNLLSHFPKPLMKAQREKHIALSKYWASNKSSIWRWNHIQD